MTRTVYNLTCASCGGNFKSSHRDSKTCSRRCTSQHFRFVEDECLFESLDRSEYSYVVGLIASDGCVLLDKHSQRWRVNVTLKDLEHITRLHKMLCTTGTRKIYESRGYYSINHMNDTTIRTLISLGVSERKSLDMRISCNLLEAVDWADYVRGVFDGDGSAYVSNKSYGGYTSIKFTSGSVGFLEDFRKMIEIGCGAAGSITRDVRGTAGYLSYHRQRDVLKLTRWMYGTKSGFDSLFLSRKRDRLPR